MSTPSAAQSTIEALIYDVRDCGEAALHAPANHRRISELSPQQLEEVCARLAKRCPAKPDGVPLHVIAALTSIARRSSHAFA